MNTHLTRRQFLATAGACVAGSASLPAAADPPATPTPGLPLVDLHVHLDNSTIDRVVALGQERGVRFGIVEHAGTKENQYPVVLSNDAELKAYLAMLEGKPVWKGVQAEWTDWMSCFSRETLARLDYVLTDTMTFPGRDGRRVKLWLPDAPGEVDLTNPEAFMDHYVDWHVEILSQEPIDILANVSWLPAPLANDYEKFWTEARVKRVLDAARQYGVALEISSSFRLPKLTFLKQARAAGVKFTFGSNGRYPNMGKLDYSLEMARALGLSRGDLFTPAPAGQRAVERRKF
jgi:histidinol phosphatase-like PHP family hydrolase